jgi:chromatin structure-remodeling complex subunit RSC9
MKIMFFDKPDGELTQVDFWTLYKDRFTPHGEQSMMVASDVIKNVSLVFPRAQAMVIPGPPQRFVVRGVTRRMEDVPGEKFKCLWDREHCAHPPLAHAGALYDHVLQHINADEAQDGVCLWATCARAPLPRANLRAHVLTHLPSAQPVALHPEQSAVVTLPAPGHAHPVADPTTRPPPPPRGTALKLRKPLVDPPSSALTALLCVRVLFRTAFASVEAAPRLDADHFGFPGTVDDDGEDAQDDLVVDEKEERALRRGKRAFGSVRNLLESVQIKQETLMGWVTEMVQTSA